MACMLDLVTGGALLPYVYCKKVTLETNEKDITKTDATLLLEIYQEKSKLLNSTWLNNLGTQGVNFLDSMYIQVVKTTNSANCKKLLASNDPMNIDPSITADSLKTGTPGVFLSSPSIPGNVYVAKTQYGDAYLPRGAVSWWEETPSINDPIRGGRVFETRLLSPDSDSNVALNYNDVPSPIQVSNSSLIGNLSTENALADAVKQGKVREEFINQKEYYVIPFEYKIEEFDENSNENSLGLMFYSFLHVPSWIEQLEIDGNSLNILDYSDFFEELVIEGPINTEIVFLNGEVQQTREAFFLPSGIQWDGSAHLHAIGISEAPDGYSGNGGLSGLTTGAEYTGWMAGEEHTAALPKLRLARVPNNKIADFRHSLFQEPLDTALGLSGVHIPGTEPNVPVLGQGTAKIEEFLTPFQKEKRRDFNVDALGRPIDSETEFSKLYICRDRDNNARGMFFINILELLKNQSNLFPIMFDQGLITDDLLQNPPAQEYILSILNKSKLLQIRLYRDRVKKHVINTRYENYSNDEAYEEPSQLIGVIGDEVGYLTPNQNFSLSEITGIVPGTEQQIRYFSFADREAGLKQAGLYMYRLEIDFKDGSYEFLYELYRDMNKTKVLLDEYYDLAVSSYSQTEYAGEWNYSSEKTSESVLKKMFKRYYKNGSFDGNKFFDLVTNYNNFNYPDSKPWISAPAIMYEFQRIFGLFKGVSYTNYAQEGGDKKVVNFSDIVITNMIDPVVGSPKGISFFSEVLKTALLKLESLLLSTKVNKTGSEIDNNSVPTGYNYNNFLDIVVSPGDFTIREEHTFDHPSELFEAVSNESIFSDYLSVGEPMSSPVPNLRIITKKYYQDRCQLEAAKLSPIARTKAGFDGTIPESDIGSIPAPFGSTPVDYFKNTGYSYLAPSIVQLLGPENAKSYYATYKAFKPDAVFYLNNEQTDLSRIHSSDFFAVDKHDKLIVGLLNYSNSKKETQDADLMESFYEISATDQGFSTLFSLREGYKRIYEKLNMTFHAPNKHDEFFGEAAHKPRKPGAMSINIPDDEEYNLPNGLNIVEDFSDSGVFPVIFMKRFLYNEKQGLTPLEPSLPGAKLYKPNLPNNLKISRAYNNKKGSYSVIHDKITAAYDSADKTTYSSFFFFQNSLTSKIEVFRGTGSNSKNDENSWSLLTEEDLQLTGQNKLFCRISLFDEKLKKGIIIPILDKYFLISPVVRMRNSDPVVNKKQPSGRDLTIPEQKPPRTGRKIPADYRDSARNFWEEQNHRKVEEQRKNTDRGLTTLSGQETGTSQPYVERYGPAAETAESTGTSTQPVSVGTTASPSIQTEAPAVGTQPSSPNNPAGTGNVGY